MKALLAVAIVAAAAAPAHAQWMGTAYVDNDVAGDVQSGRVGVGASVGYYLQGRIGLELDAEVHGHFFRDEDVAGLVPPGVDLDTRAMLATSNVIVPYCIGDDSIGSWCPYATAGLGVIRALFDGNTIMPGAQGISRSQTNPAVDGGVGVMHALTRWVGFRVDARYLHAFVDERSTDGGYFKDYGYWRVAVGVTVGFPASTW